MYARVRLTILVLVLTWSGMASAAAPESTQTSIEISISPYLPVTALVQAYQPMLTFLESKLNRRVVLLSAPDYRTFNERILRQEFSFVIAVAPSASLAISEAGYIPLLRPAVYSLPTVVVAEASKYRDVADLKGSRVAMMDPMGIVSMQGVQMLRENHINPESDVTVQYFPNQAAEVNHVISGEMDAAIISDRALVQMPRPTREQVRVLASWEKGAAPGVVYLVSKTVSTELAARVKNAILEYVHDSDEGRVFMEQSGYGDLVPTQARELEFLAPYGTRLKALLAAPR